ncbi:MAG TPA: hypothetical protein VGN72_04925 [Tepidisphaeraceae bacterium]|jgi:class 3 adenylate cyclase|nr:hypothetical protein [Tepidisphaeraceae bacterium]
MQRRNADPTQPRDAHAGHVVGSTGDAPYTMFALARRITDAALAAIVLIAMELMELCNDDGDGDTRI